MEIHWRDPDTVDASEREAADKRLRELAAGHSDLIDVWIDLTEDPHHRQGSQRTTIRAQVRGASLVSHGDGADLGLALRHALQTFERELRELRARRSDRLPDWGTAPPLRGVVDRVHPAEDHGFLISESGEQVYFHRNALGGGLDLDTLQEGDTVAFNLEAGDKGAQATVVVPPHAG